MRSMSWQRRLGFFAALIAGVVVYGAFRAYDARYPSWKEEVQLIDGRMIIVRQKHRYYQNYGTAESWVTFSLPEMGGEQTWHSYLKPMRVDVYEGKVYVFGRPRGPLQVQHYVYPRHFLVAFQWDQKEFRRIPFMSVPEELRNAENVFPCVPADRRKTLTWKTKENRWCTPTDLKGLFGRKINMQAYNDRAVAYAKRAGSQPITE